MTRIALIPAYEPEQLLIDIIRELYEKSFEIILIDDGSGPDYKELFHTLSDYAVVISYETNRGKGHALKTGLTHIKKMNRKGVIVTMDADGQHLISDAIRLCDEFKNTDTDLLIGSRILSKDSPVKSRIGNGITRWIYRTMTGVNVYDTQSGLRVFSTDLIPSMLSIPGDRYEYEMNVLLFFAKQKRKIAEVPISTIYFDKTNSVSHFHAVSDSFKIYKEIFRFAGSSFASFLIDYMLYSLFLIFLGNSALNLLYANVSARAISSVFNFFVNRTFVFKSKGAWKKECFQYYGLVIFIICINSLFLTILTGIGFNPYFAKLFVESILFFFNYILQHTLIFKKKKD